MDLQKIYIFLIIQFFLNIFRSDTRQYAYAALFSKEECESLSNNNIILQILQHENATRITAALSDEQGIYAGRQMVLATYGARGFHSEYRLLFPSPGTDVSPVQELVNTNRNAYCAIFYSLNSPCVGICANTENERNIIKKLSVFNKFNNNKAFVYRFVYIMDFTNRNIGKERIWDGLTQINKNMDVYRCFPRKCLKCFFKRSNKLKNKGHCLNN